MTCYRCGITLYRVERERGTCDTCNTHERRIDALLRARSTRMLRRTRTRIL